jgi:uncharacterized membrane protein
MRTPASILGHPIHPMLVPIPIGLWLFSLVCDLAYVFGNGDPVWRVVALYAIVGGLIGALAAAVPGLVDLLSLPAAPKRTAIAHMTINLTVVALYAINAWMRLGASGTAARSITETTILMSIAGVAMLVVSGWLGGKMVYEGGVGVSSGEPPPLRR